MAEILNMEPAPVRPALLATPRARVGLIIPSSNRLAEPQFRHYLPDDIGVHTTRLRMTGPWHRPLSQLRDAVREAAGSLADSKCDVIIFNCTGGAMSDGAEEEARTIELIAEESDAAALSTGDAAVEALRALGITKPVLVSPYVQSTNDAEKIYLEGLGFRVVNDIALGLSGGNEYIHVPPEKWLDTVREAVTPEADGVFLSCTNTSQIEIIADAERTLGIPCINSNQAVIWRTLAEISKKYGEEFRPVDDGRALGRLFERRA